MNCKLCESKDRDLLEKALVLGELSMAEVAKKINSTEAEVWKHMEEHTNSPGKEMPADRDEVLGTLISQLYTRVEDLLEQPLKTGTERSLEGHVRQLRGLIKDISGLKGELGKKSTKHQEVNFDNWSEFLLNNLCKDCKQKFAEFLAKKGDGNE